MGLTAEALAEKYGITRAESDAYALMSQNRAEAAIKAGHFASQIMPVEMPQRKGPPLLFAQDEHPRFGSTLEGLEKLAPAFSQDGIVTAGSASGITDGAAGIVFMALDVARARGLRPLLEVNSIAEAGVDPEYMGLGPVPATKKALSLAGMSMSDVGLIEINEAFAPQVIACERELGYNREIANVDGGAIALGHPIGMTGVRLLVQLAHAMPRTGAETGLATLCINGGMGMSAIVSQVG
jgi:acetyl-CoA C-acetyltransferase